MEIEHRENALELIFGDLSLSKLVEIKEEFFNSNSFHDDVALKSRLDIFWVVGNLDSLLEVSIVDYIKVLGGVLVESRTSISQLSVEDIVLWLWIFSNIPWEDVLWSIDVSAEHEVIDLSNISFVQVLSKEQLEELLSWWDEGKLLHDSSELLGSNMAALSSIIILKLRLDKNSFVLNLCSNSIQKGNQSVLFIIGEVGSGLRVFDHGNWVNGVIKNNIDIVAEIGIVHKTILLFVFAQ
jgi:hypothetical protein